MLARCVLMFGDFYWKWGSCYVPTSQVQLQALQIAAMKYCTLAICCYQLKLLTPRHNQVISIN